MEETQELNKIRRSGLFDEYWYLENNPDVVQAKAEPSLHYLHYGGMEGRDPSPKFSSKWYLDTYEDVKKARINPLVHYLRYGKKEGRLTHVQEKNDIKTPFFSDYLAEVTSSTMNWHEDNYDIHRFDPSMPKEEPYVGDMPQNILAARELVRPYLLHFEWLYEKLADNQSKEILVKLLAFRTLGYRRVKLPTNTPAYWDSLEKMEQLADRTDSLYKYSGNMDWELFLIDFHKIDIPIRFYGTAVGGYNALEQYRCGEIAAELGDYVVDAGACWGETALYFAYRVGESGRVFSYEFVPENLNVLRRNLALNPEISRNIQIIEKAVWSESDAVLNFNANGPASRVGKNQTDDAPLHTLTLSIDDLFMKNGLPKLDFIKMDIEGAELSALHGATQVLRRFKPKLAICVYHNLTDIFEIPEYLNSLNLGYRFFLRHYSIHAEETVLYATVS